jgi:hypothetical protein
MEELMRCLHLTLLPLVLVACTEQQPAAPDVDGAPVLAATSEWYEDFIVAPEGDYTFYAPCIDDYVDEIGTIYRKRHRVIQDDGVTAVHWRLWLGKGFVLRGAKTGDWVPLPGQLVTITTTLNAARHQSQVLKYAFKNTATGMVMDWPTRYHITINANGEVTTERYAEPCTVRH